MAKASKDIQVVRTNTYTLTLSEDEASALTVVLASIGGDEETSPRKHTRAVLDALVAEGLSYLADPFEDDHPARKVSGSIRFHSTAREARSTRNSGSPFRHTLDA